MWNPRVKRIGFICGHDYYQNNCNGIKEYLDREFGLPDKIFEDSSWLYKKERIIDAIEK